MMYVRDRLVLALLTLISFGLIALLVAVAFAMIVPDSAMSPEFVMTPKDRPVLETPQQVWQARTTGVSEFYFDGMHYVIVNLPKEYVDYSSWYVRMP